MNAAHWHLAMNHLPVVGSLVGTCLLAVALWRKSEEAIRTTFGLLAAVALTAVPVYFTGEPAEAVIMDSPDFVESLADAHEKAATASIISIAIVGLAALTAMIAYRKTPQLPRWLGLFILALSLVATGLFGWTANLGGRIHHPETRPATVTPPAGKSE